MQKAARTTLPLPRWVDSTVATTSVHVHTWLSCRQRPAASIARRTMAGTGVVRTVDMLPLFPVTVVGSFPQPEWLIDRAKLTGRFPPRVRARELSRPAPEHLARAQDEATRLASREQEDADVNIVTGGAVRRESYSNPFATALLGLDLDNPGEALDRSGHPNPVPRVVGPIRRPRPVQVRDVNFLRQHTERAIKVTVPGPFTMAQQA